MGTGGQPGGNRRRGPHPEDRSHYWRDRLSRVFLADDLAALRTGGGVDVPVPSTLGLFLDPSGLPGLRGGYAGAAAGAAAGPAGAAATAGTAAAGTAAGAAGILTPFVALRGLMGGGAGLMVNAPIFTMTFGSGTCCASGEDAAEAAMG